MELNTKFSYTHKANYTEEDGSKGEVSATVVGIVTEMNEHGYIGWECVDTKNVKNAPSYGFHVSGGGFSEGPYLERFMPNFTTL